MGSSEHSLAISLGHNSSAVYVRDGEVIAGYEEERFSQVKSDSNFPAQSILELRTRYNLPKDTHCFVGHWFTDCQLPPENKYWRPKMLMDLFPSGEIESLNADFTHHDSHLLSAKVFAGEDFANGYHAVVADGFGSFGECISVYQCSGDKYRLLHRVFGFEKSLGMLYQYATAFLGMKMHNHEYKMLAYEVHIDEVLDANEIQILQDMAMDRSGKWLKSVWDRKLKSTEFDPVISLDALPSVRAWIDDMLTDVLKEFGMLNSDIREKRIVIAYFVQKVVELVMTTLVNGYQPRNLLVVGGLFYNVKLNHLLANITPGKFCVMPLAGDQGAGLGVYHAYQGDLKWPDNLLWGDRDLGLVKDVEGVINCSKDAASSVIAGVLADKGWVNVVRGRMEYGPRALCNTTTLALPDPDITEQINKANDRTAEMPMAPVLTMDQAKLTFSGIDKVHKSLEYMICARKYLPGEERAMLGAAHFYPEDGVYTGRPQITAEPMMVSLLQEFGPLVNTSFNYHGVPIVNGMDQILHSHEMQCKTAPELNPTTVIITEE